jgi:Lrp/AsnC family leucine-responsive transcriptional regulator
MIDPTDIEILKILQENSRTSNAEIARRVGMAPSGIFERLRKLEEKGVIREYAARLDSRQLGYDVVAFVFVTTDVRVQGVPAGRQLAAIPEVQEVHHVAGEDCYLLKVRAATTEALGLLLREQIAVIPSVRSTRTVIVLDTLKETTALALPEKFEDAAR